MIPLRFAGTVYFVAAAFVSAAESGLTGLALNVGSGGHYSVNRLVDLLGGEKIFIPKRPGEPDTTFADTALIRRTLGWRPTVTLEDGVRQMLEHLENWRDAPLWDPGSIEKATEVWFRHLGNDSSNG